MSIPREKPQCKGSNKCSSSLTSFVSYPEKDTSATELSGDGEQECTNSALGAPKKPCNRQERQVCPPDQNCPGRKESSRVSTLLRRSELAGWRTKSLFPRSGTVYPTPGVTMTRHFFPILKLRGLPFFSAAEHVREWFGDLVRHVEKLEIISHVHPLSSGFGIVLMDSPEAAWQAWHALHRKKIGADRFIEVFALFPRNCPLYRKKQLSDRINANTVEVIEPLEIIDPAACSSGFCTFCGSLFSKHCDEGDSSRRHARLFNLAEDLSKQQLPAKQVKTSHKGPNSSNSAFGGLSSLVKRGACLPVSFLEVPALLYLDNETVSREELNLLRIPPNVVVPDSARWVEVGGLSLPTPEACSEAVLHNFDGKDANMKFLGNVVEQGRAARPLNESESFLSREGPATANGEYGGFANLYFDVFELKEYDVRSLLLEVVGILKASQKNLDFAIIIQYRRGGLCIAEIGRLLSVKAKAYLFVTEMKLEGVLQNFSDLFFDLKRERLFNMVTLKSSADNVISAIKNIDARGLSRRKKKDSLTPDSPFRSHAFSNFGAAPLNKQNSKTSLPLSEAPAQHHSQSVQSRAGFPNSTSSTTGFTPTESSSRFCIESLLDSYGFQNPIGSFPRRVQKQNQNGYSDIFEMGNQCRPFPFDTYDFKYQFAPANYFLRRCAICNRQLRNHSLINKFGDFFCNFSSPSNPYPHSQPPAWLFPESETRYPSESELPAANFSEESTTNLAFSNGIKPFSSFCFHPQLTRCYFASVPVRDVSSSEIESGVNNQSGILVPRDGQPGLTLLSEELDDMEIAALLACRSSQEKTIATCKEPSSALLEDSVTFLSPNTGSSSIPPVGSGEFCEQNDSPLHADQHSNGILYPDIKNNNFLHSNFVKIKEKPPPGVPQDGRAVQTSKVDQLLSNMEHLEDIWENILSCKGDSKISLVAILESSKDQLA